MASADAELPAFDDALDQLQAITDLGKLLATRLAFTQASRAAVPAGDGTHRRHDLALDIARLVGGARDAGDALAAAQELDDPIEQAFHVFDRRVLASARERRDVPFVTLVRALELSPLEQRVVVALAAPEIDPEIAYAYHAAYDSGGRRLDVAWLALLVGGRAFRRREDVIRALAPGGALRRHRLVVLGDGALAQASVRLHDRVVALLRGDRSLDAEVALFCRVAEPPPLAELVVEAGVVERLQRALAGSRVVVWGPEGTGKATLVEAIARAGGRAALRVELAGVGAAIVDRLATCGREAALREAVIVLDTSGLAATPPHEVVAQLGAAIAAMPVAVAIVATEPLAWLGPYVPELVEVELPPPSYRERTQLWTRALAGAADASDLELVAGRYAFGAAVIARAARRAITTARLRAPDAPRVRLDELVEAARTMFSHRLGSIAQRIPAGFTWDDLVLPQDTLDQIHEVVRFARKRPILLEDWGFAKKLPYGRGISAILAGPPGTGKTMVAQLLAHELGYDLYRIDLSQVVNKYIGETEKNLARIFAEAENAHAVLFFDEADSMFAKRTEVRSSNDRYANLEVNYLLQRMETFDGVTLLATNIEQGIDEAFKRRVRFTVQFELPDDAVRARLWRSMFPAEAPLEPDIDWNLLARRYEMAGGYIKKAVMRAALAAASAGRKISQADLLAAATQEYREMGRVTI